MTDNFEHSIKIGLLGNSNVGKTSLLKKFVKWDYVPSGGKIATIGID